ncbi:hypothetical protein BD779DRAFT_203594 [Infundibulicybe gibba]|nr:hypothetical protein BD779DRAFT_203594 [Infundibulicybe gibba]
MKILSAANHIINDDVRRMLTFGMTIEDDEMTLWYFSRSHSVKSDPFNYIKDLESFTAISLSFMFSSDEEMGYDPRVTRSMDGSNYIYRFEEEDRYFQTRRLIVEHRSLCITGRMTRVWEAIELDREQTHKIGGPVVLKDVWLDEAARTEKQIQDEIFGDIHSFPVSKLDSLEDLSDEMRTHLKEILANDKYKEYFLDIVCEYQGETTKPLAPSASPEHGLFDPPPSTPPPSPPVTCQYPCNPALVLPGVCRAPWRYVPRRQYRLVYNQVCEALHDLDSLQVITGVAADCLTALQLLYCAGWVHRDVSSGNILAYKVAGTMRGKLADLEYAKKFPLNSGSDDPKTGTPFFRNTRPAIYFTTHSTKERPQSNIYFRASS